jgi:hypothetical protein
MPRSARPTSVESQPETCSTIRVSGWDGGFQTSSDQIPVPPDQNSANANLSLDCSHLDPETASQSAETASQRAETAFTGAETTFPSAKSAFPSAKSTFLSAESTFPSAESAFRGPEMASRRAEFAPISRENAKKYAETGSSTGYYLPSTAYAAGFIRLKALFALCALLLVFCSLPFAFSSARAAHTLDRVAVRDSSQGQRPRIARQKDLVTLKGSNKISSTPSGSAGMNASDPGVSLRSTPGYSLSAFQADSVSLSRWEREGVRLRSLAGRGKEKDIVCSVALSPHPDPLPKGEGTLHHSLLTARCSQFAA